MQMLCNIHFCMKSLICFIIHCFSAVEKTFQSRKRGGFLSHPAQNSLYMHNTAAQTHFSKATPETWTLTALTLSPITDSTLVATASWTLLATA